MELIRTRVIRQMRDDPDGEGGCLVTLGHAAGSEIVGGIAYENRWERHGLRNQEREQPSWRKLLPALAAFEARLAAIEQQLGITPED